ncbi:hypothetical protein CLF_109114 [Clonorchis sinensis]|uniref:Uncharacterized protein n=1 Tax=Clonorchis sinensis TaxID=79923 RepID=G7YS93_CLOSI|nr:hypothetical protein CLF_109114 [Clonorchis sinensis]
MANRKSSPGNSPAAKIEQNASTQVPLENISCAVYDRNVLVSALPTSRPPDLMTHCFECRTSSSFTNSSATKELAKSFLHDLPAGAVNAISPSHSLYGLASNSISPCYMLQSKKSPNPKISPTGQITQYKLPPNNLFCEAAIHREQEIKQPELIQDLSAICPTVLHAEHESKSMDIRTFSLNNAKSTFEPAQKPTDLSFKQPLLVYTTKAEHPSKTAHSLYGLASNSISPCYMLQSKKSPNPKIGPNSQITQYKLPPTNLFCEAAIQREQERKQTEVIEDLGAICPTVLHTEHESKSTDIRHFSLNNANSTFGPAHKSTDLSSKQPLLVYTTKVEHPSEIASTKDLEDIQIRFDLLCKHHELLREDFKNMELKLRTQFPKIELDSTMFDAITQNQINQDPFEREVVKLEKSYNQIISLVQHFRRIRPDLLVTGLASSLEDWLVSIRNFRQCSRDLSTALNSHCTELHNSLCISSAFTNGKSFSIMLNGLYPTFRGQKHSLIHHVTILGHEPRARSLRYCRIAQAYTGAVKVQGLIRTTDFPVSDFVSVSYLVLV